MKRFTFCYLSTDTERYVDSKNSDKIMKLIKNPTPYNDFIFKNGKYLIRGNSKNSYKEYYVFDNKWYLHITSVLNETWRFITYHNFPQLSKKEWNNMRLTGAKRLSKKWSRNFMAYEHFMDMRELQADYKIYRIYC